MKNRLGILMRDFFINRIASSKLVIHEIRYMIYKLYGIDIQTKNINPGCFMGGNNIKIGENSFINYDCKFDNSAFISIGKNCDIGFEVLFCTSSHKTGDKTRRAGKPCGDNIIINNGTWIGARSTILGGVTVGEGCIIASNSVVIKDCDANGLYAGVPAVRVKELK